MQNAFWLALRNLQRHPRRNLLIGGTIFLGSAVLLCSLFLADGISDGIVRNLVAIDSGSVLVTYQKKADEIRDPKSFEAMHAHVQSALGALGSGAQIRMRLKFDAILFGPDGDTATLAVKGVVPEAEVALRDYLVPDSGKMLSADNQIYLSRQAADQLHAQAGDRVTVLVNTWGAQINAQDFSVAGVFANIAPWADYVAYITLPDAQRLFGSSIANQYLVDTPDLADAAPLAEKVRTLLKAEPVWADDYRQAGGFLLGIASANRYTFLGFSAMLFLVVGMGIASLVGISVRERHAEFGMMLAFGFLTRQILMLLVLEIVLLAVLAGILALGASALVYVVAHHNGIALQGVARNAFGSARLSPAMHPYQFAVFLVASLGMALLGAFVPARKILRFGTDEILRST